MLLLVMVIKVVIILYYHTIIIINIDYKISLYTCCRDGIPRQNKGMRKSGEKRMRHVDTRKLPDSYCLARMKVKIYKDTERVEVNYTSTHSHSIGLDQCKYLPLPITIRREIQEKFVQGISLERIMDG